MWIYGLFTAVAFAADPLAALGFLSGRWTDGAFTAVYSAPAAGAVLSYSEARNDGAVVFYEFERFAVEADVVVYRPYPGGKPATELRLTSAEADHAVFENPDKDWPTRIDFRRSGASLVITLDDPHDGDARIQRLELKASP